MTTLKISDLKENDVVLLKTEGGTQFIAFVTEINVQAKGIGTEYFAYSAPEETTPNGHQKSRIVWNAYNGEDCLVKILMRGGTLLP